MNIRIATAAIALVMTSLASGKDRIRIDDDDDDDDEGCLTSWKAFDNNCYQFITSPMTWSSAKAECEKRHSYLVWVESKEEHKYLVDNIRRRIGQSTWIGYTDKTSEGKWQWLETSRSHNFVKWSAGEPNNKGNNEHCAAMWKKGNYRWFDVNCEKKLPFICKTFQVWTKE